MRIALLSDWFHPRPGGIEAQLRGLAVELTRQGHALEVITSFPGADRVENVSVTRLSGIFLPNTRVIIPFGIEGKLRSILENAAFDVVHIHLSSVTPLSFLALKIATQARLPTVVTMHSQSPGAVMALRLMRRVGWFDPKSASLTVVSKKLADQLVPFGVDPANALLPNGADYGFWSAAMTRPKAHNGELRIVTAMRLEWTKRPLALAAILRNLRDRGIKARLDIAGTGQLGNWLTRRADKFGVGQQIHLHGWQEREALRALYADADVFLSPSTRESFGIAALEARMAGLPVITRADTGIAEFLSEEDGVACPSDETLCDALAVLAQDPEALRRLSGERPGLRRFDWSEIAAQHLVHYRQAATDRTSAR